MLHIQLEDAASHNARLEIYNAMGQLVLSRDLPEGEQRVAIDLGGRLPTGTYLLHLLQGEQRHVERLLVH